MADETTTQAPAAEVTTGPPIVLPPNTAPPPAPEPEPDTAKAKLRAFEDEHLGKDAVRIKGEIERGHGSPFAAMKPELKRHYEALERVVAAEQKVDDAAAALAAAKVAHEAAMADVTAAEDAARLAADAAPSE